MVKSQLSAKVNNIERKLSKINPPEVKRFVRSDQDTTPTYTGEIFNLSAIPQGETDAERVGDQVHCIGLNWRSAFTIVDTPAEQQNIRIVIFRDIANTITAPNQILLASAVGTVGAPNAPYNQQQRDRFVVLYDKSFTFANYGGGVPTRMINFRKKLNFRMDFDNTTTTSFRNPLKVLIISDLATTVMAHDFYSEILYTDA